MCCKKHKQLQASLVERLKEKGYESIYQNIEYHVNIDGVRYDGEVDVLAKSTVTHHWHFYEVKCYKRYKKAQEQYERFVKSHPDLLVKGVYFSTYDCKRLR